MGWVKLEDGFLDHPKFLRVGPVAGYIALAAVAWSNRNLTDGFIPEAQVARLANLEGIQDERLAIRSDSERIPDGIRAESNGLPTARYVNARGLAATLCEAGLWEPAENGYFIHDYHDHQPTAEAITARRAKDRTRKTDAPEPKRRIRADSKRIPSGGSADSSAQEVRSKKEEEPPLSPPRGEGARVLSFDRKPVPEDRRQLAEQILHEFNQQAGTHYSAYTGNQKPSEGLHRIIGALTRSPTVDFDQAAAAIRWQLARPYWDGAARPGNVFGPNVFDSVVESSSLAAQPASTTDFVSKMNSRRTPSGEGSPAA